MEMTSAKLGRVPVSIQNDGKFQGSVYCIQASEFKGDPDQEDIANFLAAAVEEPERFMIYQENGASNVYTKEPEAAVQLAVQLNQQHGVEISEEETEAFRSRLALQ
ncbi:hypothetical protein [Paenibacillus turpanensis]|uniref:hypothetical protein n=1 Tax=Paenibacillus turpanensis TaxID=2689078 RepID=UPI001407367E|nr:hypothetical protein [Paenibacillus turpanensis]